MKMNRMALIVHTWPFNPPGMPSQSAWQNPWIICTQAVVTRIQIDTATADGGNEEPTSTNTKCKSACIACTIAAAMVVVKPCAAPVIMHTHICCRLRGEDTFEYGGNFA